MNLGKSITFGKYYLVEVDIDSRKVHLNEGYDENSLTIEDTDTSSFFEYCSINQTKASYFTPEEEKMFAQLNVKKKHALAMLSNDQIRDRFLRLGSILENLDDDYLQVYISNRQFLDSLQSYRYDFDAANKYVSDSSIDLSHDFITGHMNEDVLSNAYSMHSSVTGRLTVTEGINFLVLPKWTRSYLRSPNGDKLVEFDLNALEPTVLFQHLMPGEFDSESDLYTSVGNRWFDKSLNRDQLKQITISLSYGASDKALCAAAGDFSQEMKRRISHMKKELGLKKFGRELKKELEGNGYIKNMSGRKIFPKSNPNIGTLINNFVQSSAVDVSLELFRKITETCEIQPHIVIHDALYISGNVDSIKLTHGSAIRSEILKRSIAYSIEEV